VIGKSLGNQAPHRRLGGAVGGGDRRQVGLFLDPDRLAEIRADRRSGGVGERDGQRQFSVERGSGTGGGRGYAPT
jgi:hypothetical protein